MNITDAFMERLIRMPIPEQAHFLCSNKEEIDFEIISKKTKELLQEEGISEERKDKIYGIREGSFVLYNAGNLEREILAE